MAGAVFIKSFILKKAIFLRALGLWIAFCPAAGWALNNGGFELGSTSGWSVYNPSSLPVTWGVTSTASNVYSGNYAGALTVFGGATNTNSMLIVYNSTNVASWTPNSMGLATVYLKTANLQLADPQDSLSIVLVINDAQGKNLVYSYGNGNFLGTQGYTPVKIFFTLPDGASVVQIQLVIQSGIVSGAAYVDGVDIQRVASLGPLSTNLPLAQVLRDTNGTPRFYLNGVAQVPSFFFGNNGNPVIYNEMSLAAAAGVNVVELGVSLPWGGTGTGMMQQSIQANTNALFLLRVNLSPPAWWTSSNASLMCVDENGMQNTNNPAGPSLASGKYISALTNQLNALIGFLRSTNCSLASRIIGYHIGAKSGGEWFYPDTAYHFWDYSQPNQTNFIAWLQTNYTSIAELNNAWHTSYASFTNVQIPSTNDWFSANDGVFRDPSQQHAVPDYAKYFNNLTANTIANLAGYIKTLTANKSLTLAFYGYRTELINNAWQRGIAHSGHLGIEELLKSTNIDILCSPVSYYDRQPGGPANLMSLVDTVALAGKLYLQENDSYTFLQSSNAVAASGGPNLSIWYSTLWDTMNCYRRDYGDVLAHNQAMWWMDLWADGRLNTNSIWTNNALVIGTASNVVAQAQPFQPQIAVLYNEETPFWLTAKCDNLTYPNQYAIRSVFEKSGASVGYYLVRDLPKIPASAKLLVFPDAFYLDAAERAMISQAKTNGRTFLWLYAPGYVNETNLSVNTMQQVTGFSFVRNATAISATVKMTNTTSPITSALINQTYGNGNSITPHFYVNAGVGTEILGVYPNDQNRPAFVAQDYGTWKSVFSGGLDLNVPTLRSIARYAGVNLLADGDNLFATNKVNFIGQYMYVYAISNAGTHCFQLPGEKVPNGNFEKFTGALPTSGFGQWISPNYGTLPACRVINTNAAAGSNACATGPFSSGASQYAEPLAIKLQAQSNTTYQVSFGVYVDGLNTTSATNGNYIYLVFQPHDWTPNSWTGVIAQGTNVYLQNKTWTQLAGSFTFTGGAAPYANELDIVLKVYGPYSATNLLIDNVSVRESGCNPVNVFDLTQNNSALGSGVTSWAANFASNEQKIFRLVPALGTTTTTLAAVATPQTYGTVTFGATVSPGTASGTVTFKDGSTTLGSDNLIGGSAAFTPTASQLAVGSGHSITAVYNGDASYAPSTSSASPLNITAKALTVTGLSVPASKVYDGTTATASPSGTPTLQGAEAAGPGTGGDGKPYAGDAVTISGSAIGSYNSKDVATANLVTFNGLSTANANYTITAPVQAATITQATTAGAFTSAPNPSLPGWGVTFSAAVTNAVPGGPAPSGNVQFKANYVAFGNAVALNTNGVAAFITNSLPHGSNTVTADYAGDGNFLGRTNSVVQIVNTPPIAPNTNAGVAKNQAMVFSILSLLALAHDADGDPLSVIAAGPTSTNGPANNVVLDTGAGTITYTPATNYVGADSFTFTVSDNYGGTASPTVLVTVASLLTIVNSPTILPDGHFSVGFAGVPGFSYTIQYSPNVSGSPWTTITNLTAGADGLFQFVDPTEPASSSRFYRISHP